MSTRERVAAGVLSIILLVLSGAVLAPAFGPAAGDASPPPSLPTARPYVEGIVGRATNISPFGARSAADRAIVALAFRGLVRLGPDGVFVPDLAERWTVDVTGGIWTFHLRPGLVWQDGDPLTAEDVAFTAGVLADPLYAGPGASSWSEVSATVIDPLTVRFTLATPLGGFLAAATQPIAPLHLLGSTSSSELPDASFGRRPIGSGWFQVTSLDDERAVLTAWVPESPDTDPGGFGADGATPRPTDSFAEPSPRGPAAQPRAYLSGIEVRFFDDDAGLATAWATGELDGAVGIMPATAAELADGPDVRLLRYPGTTLLEVVLNLRPAVKTFSDPSVRRALLAAIDRDRIVRDVLAGYAIPADGPIQPSSWAFDAEATGTVAHDPEASVAALIAAGWKEVDAGWMPKGATDPLTISLLVAEATANPVQHAVALAIAEDWRAIGIRVTLVELPASGLIRDRLRSGDFTAAAVSIGLGLDPDLYPLFASSQSASGGPNVSGLQDPALDKLLVAARAPGTEEARKAAYVELQKALAAGTFVLPIAFRDELFVVRETLSGPSIRLLGSPGDRFWDVLTWRLADDR